MAHVTIHFVGPLRVFLKQPTCEMDVKEISDLRSEIDRLFEPLYREAVSERRITSSKSLWEDCNILLNRQNIRLLDHPILKDGDDIHLLLQVAGG